ncbi:MAG: tyrosine-type recombinase/integrase [Lachnospiraceae bacterium]|nr:tyrosine-type recombinase/integrase [Lachnospiraceae bacterium]
MAIKWCDEKITSTERRPCILSINRLNDVYEHGKILASHLRLFGTLSDAFQEAISSYLTHISSYTEGTREWYRRVCTHFCLFAQHHNTDTPNRISYELVKDYHAFVSEAGTYRHYETQISNFIAFLEENGNCNAGLSFCMFYGKFERVLLASDLSDDERIVLEKFKDLAKSTADDFKDSISDFRKKLLAIGYGMQSSAGVVCYLNWLYVFLASAGMGYSRQAADLWANAAAGIVFDAKFIDQASRSFDLYNDYITKGMVFPNKFNSRNQNYYDQLPSWCKEKIDRFVDDRTREGKAESTIRQNRSHISKFCIFLVSEGIESFDDLTPELVKKSILRNAGLAIGTRWSYNYGVRIFLISVEIRNEIRPGFHLAVPRMCSEEERVVTVMAQSDIDSIEAYCQNASAPIELRDAAILKLGINTAFRSIDVVSLKLSDIDWKNRIIRIIQSKTKVEHIHPIDVDTLNSIFLYLKNGRPKTAKCSNVFVASKVPFGSLGTGACINAMQRAGSKVAQFHCLRRTYATDTLRSGATIAETAELLGQSDTNSVHKYTSLDSKRMKLCPLSMREMNIGLEGRYAHV